MYLKKVIAYASEGKKSSLEVSINNGDLSDEALDLVAHFVAYHSDRRVKVGIKLDGDFFNEDYVSVCADICARSTKYEKG